MANINELRSAISNLLAIKEKSYNLPAVCLRYGLDEGTEEEAFNSKRLYVSKRLNIKESAFIISMAKQLLADYESIDFAEIAEKFLPNELFNISVLTRRSILDDLILNGSIEGALDIVTFLKRTWNDEQSKTVKLINNHISKDGYILDIYNYLSGFPQYQVKKLHQGVDGKIMNLIFSADGPKPEIIFSDSLNNEIKLVKNEEYCLIYDKPIPETGLLWIDLVKWWSKEIETYTLDDEQNLYKRLYKSLDSKPEKLFFKTYFKFRETMQETLPALIPQVYLHYDPYSSKNLNGEKRVIRQRMDFLILLSNKTRIVIEIDGKQHYSEGDKSSPKLYSEMVREDRRIKLKGYDVFRFGGYELTGAGAEKIIENFFRNLFDKYNLLPSI